MERVVRNITTNVFLSTFVHQTVLTLHLMQNGIRSMFGMNWVSYLIGI